MKKIIHRVINGAYSTIIAIFLITIIFVAKNEIIDTVRWFFKNELKVLLSDKAILTSIWGFIITLLMFNKKK
jgi:hypothetical protein